MKADVSQIALSIQDLLGALLPGMVWAVEFLTLNQLVLERYTDQSMYPSTFQVALSLVNNTTSANSDQKTAAFYTGFVVCSGILGYITNAFPTRLSEVISSYFYRWIQRLISMPKRIRKPVKDLPDPAQGDGGELKNSRFPYNDVFLKEGSVYAKVIDPYLQKTVAFEISHQPNEFQMGTFNFCKRLIKLVGPDYIRDRIMYAEAQCRMLSSLLLASMANLFLVFLALMLARGGESNQHSLYTWGLTSLAITAFIAYTFQYRRHVEVSSVYTYTSLMIALEKTGKSLWMLPSEEGGP